MKLVATHWKYLKYLIWFGLALIVAGITAGLVSGSWGIAPIALMIAGGVIVLAWLAMSGQAIGSFLGQRSTQAGTNAFIATIAMLVILGLVNFLGVRYDKRVDFTENQLFTLSPQSIEIVDRLQQPVKLWIFEAGTPNAQDRELLENFRRQNEQFSYEYVDPQAQPGLAQRFGVQSFGEVYLESGDRRKFVTTVNPQQRLSERSLTTALAQLNLDRQPKVYFLQGHGEKTLDGSGQESASQAIAQLGDENFVAEPLNLATSPKVPDDANVLVIAGPKRELLAAEVRALQDYLKRKSGLMLMLDPLTETGLNDLLESWGVELSNLVVLDPNGAVVAGSPTVAIVTQYGDHPITREFGNGISLFPIAQPLQITDTENEAEAPLLFTSEQTQAQAVEEGGQIQFDPNAPPQGPMVIGAALSRPISDNSTADENSADADRPPAEARVVVIGNSSFMADGLSDQQLNGDLFLNSVNWLSQEGDLTLSIRPRTAIDRRITLNAQQQAVLGIGSVLVLPLIGFGLAAIAWLRRR
ncbi:Gldg family protein [Microcoleus sp. FACHB-1515]|uniref:GldG family protein n=1 Tax=Cyanophyceae TaxID=3028117 RepID=UPI0016842351|nr:Gldg family protein [Microcoleus sp. FACHB-1515]MBD2091026.1 Gldg family protein [Microcoleus sp. FACHB-1515]